MRIISGSVADIGTLTLEGRVGAYTPKQFREVPTNVWNVWLPEGRKLVQDKTSESRGISGKIFDEIKGIGSTFLDAVNVPKAAKTFYQTLKRDDAAIRAVENLVENNASIQEIRGKINAIPGAINRVRARNAAQRINPDLKRSALRVNDDYETNKNWGFATYWGRQKEGVNKSQISSDFMGGINLFSKLAFGYAAASNPLSLAGTLYAFKKMDQGARYLAKRSSSLNEILKNYEGKSVTLGSRTIQGKELKEVIKNFYSGSYSTIATAAYFLASAGLALKTGNLAALVPLLRGGVSGLTAAESYRGMRDITSGNFSEGTIGRMTTAKDLQALNTALYAASATSNVLPSVFDIATKAFTPADAYAQESAHQTNPLGWPEVAPEPEATPEAAIGRGHHAAQPAPEATPEYNLAPAPKVTPEATPEYNLAPAPASTPEAGADHVAAKPLPTTTPEYPLAPSAHTTPEYHQAPASVVTGESNAATAESGIATGESPIATVESGIATIESGLGTPEARIPGEIVFDPFDFVAREYPNHPVWSVLADANIDHNDWLSPKEYNLIESILGIPFAEIDAKNLGDGVNVHMIKAFLDGQGHHAAGHRAHTPSTAAATAIPHTGHFGPMNMDQSEFLRFIYSGFSDQPLYAEQTVPEAGAGHVAAHPLPKATPEYHAPAPAPTHGTNAALGNEGQGVNIPGTGNLLGDCEDAYLHNYRMHQREHIGGGDLRVDGNRFVFNFADPDYARHLDMHDNAPKLGFVPHEGDVVVRIFRHNDGTPVAIAGIGDNGVSDNLQFRDGIKLSEHNIFDGKGHLRSGYFAEATVIDENGTHGDCQTNRNGFGNDEVFIFDRIGGIGHVNRGGHAPRGNIPPADLTDEVEPHMFCRPTGPDQEPVPEYLIKPFTPSDPRSLPTANLNDLINYTTDRGWEGLQGRHPASEFRGKGIVVNSGDHIGVGPSDAAAEHSYDTQTRLLHSNEDPVYGRETVPSRIRNTLLPHEHEWERYTMARHQDRQHGQPVVLDGNNGIYGTESGHPDEVRLHHRRHETVGGHTVAGRSHTLLGGVHVDNLDNKRNNYLAVTDVSHRTSGGEVEFDGSRTQRVEVDPMRNSTAYIAGVGTGLGISAALPPSNVVRTNEVIKYVPTPAGPGGQVGGPGIGGQ